MLSLQTPNGDSHTALATRDVLAEVSRHLDRRAIGALRAASSSMKACLDATLPRAAPARATLLPELCALLGRLPSLQQLCLSACADCPLPGTTLSEAEEALAPLRQLLSAQLPQLASLTLPLSMLLELGRRSWARVWAAGADLSGPEARAALREATRGRYAGAYRPLEGSRHGVLLLPGVPLGPGVRRLAVKSAKGGSPAWPDDQTTCVWVEGGALEQLQAIHIEHVCLTHVPPPLLALASDPCAALRELALPNCQIHRLPGEAARRLARLTSLDLSGNFLKALPEGISALTALQSLDVSRNSLATLCSGLGALTGLQSLDVSNNQLLGLPRCLRPLRGLRRLVLSSNWLSGAGELGEACAGWGALTELRLANVSDKNGALVVPAASLAAHCPRLQLLDVSTNFQLDEASLEGLAACSRLARLELPWRGTAAAPARRLAEALPGLVVV